MSNEKIIDGYMCQTEFEAELGYIPVRIYPSLEYLKESKGCIDSCGAVAVRVEKVEVVIPRDESEDIYVDGIAKDAGVDLDTL